MITDLITILFNIVTPVLACAAIGYGWSRAGQPFDKAMVGKLVMFIGVPCLVFYALISVEFAPQEFGQMAAASLASSVIFLGAGWGVLKLLGLSVRTYLNPIAFGDTGNMGLPLAFLAFGDHGLALGVAYFVVNVILLVTIGIAVASNRYNPREVLRQPFIYTVAAALFFMLSGYDVPDVLRETTKMLGNFTIPLMLITLGVSLAELKLVSLPRSILIAVLRLGLGVAVGFGLAAAFGMTGAPRGVLVLMCAMPVAVITYLMAETHVGDGRHVAGAVIVSTLASFVMLPPLLWVLIN